MREPEPHPGPGRSQTARAMGPRQAAVPGPAGRLHRVDDARATSGYSIKYRGSPSSRSSSTYAGPTILLIGLGGDHRHRRRPAAGGLLGWRRGGAVDRIGGGARPGLVLDAVLRHRHAPDHHLRRRPRLVPDLGMTTPGGPTDARSPARSTSPATWSCPLAAVALGLIGGYSILMRSSIIDTRREDYITTARAKGLADAPDPAPARVPQRDAADGHPDRDQPRLRRRRRDHGRGRVQLAGPRHAHGRGARRPRLPAAPGRSSCWSRWRWSWPTSRRTSSTASSTRGCGHERHRRPAGRRRRSRRRAPRPHPAAVHAAGLSAAPTASWASTILAVFAVLALAPDAVRRRAPDGGHGARRPAPAAQRRSSCSARTSSAGTCST